MDNNRTTTVDSDSIELSRSYFENMLWSPRGYNFWPTTQDLTLENCTALIEEATGTVEESFFWDDLSEGLSFCLLTSESRIAAVTVTDRPVQYQSGSLGVEVRVWAP